MTERYVLVPCMGVAAEREHLVDICDTSTDPETRLGFTTIEDAIARCGIENLQLSRSHGVCPECFALMVAIDNGEVPMPVTNDPFIDLFRLCILGMIIERAATPDRLMAAFPAVGRARIAEYFNGLEADGFIRRGKRQGWGWYRVTPAGLAARAAHDAKLVSPTQRTFLAAKAAASSQAR